MISANTNARREGYFRREWKLAVDRTHDLDEALPFLLPVVIDGTPRLPLVTIDVDDFSVYLRGRKARKLVVPSGR